MTRGIYAALICGLVVVGVAVPAWAHHSFAAAYDTSEAGRVTVQGTIVNVRLTNPHSWFFLDVKNASGKIERWAFEAGTPSGMIRNGYKASELQPGTVVTIIGFHAKDPTQTMGMLQQLITADGKKYGMFGPQENATR